MRKKLLLLILSLVFVLNTNASHLMGGQITARQLDTMKYEIILTLYRDTMGIPMNSQISLTYECAYGAYVTWTDTIDTPPATVAINGVEEYKYVDTVIFPFNGGYRVTFDDCCRNAAITNLAQPGSEDIYLNTRLNVSGGFMNSSPVLLNPPVTLAPLMQPWIYNPLPYDADGDSLSWSLDVPLGFTGGYCGGYALPLADSTGPFTLNPNTGEITWVPNTTGNWNATVLVKEYRNGIQIGEIRRDMQILTVLDTTNGHRLAFAGTPSLQQNAEGYYEYVIPATVPFHLVMNANDRDGDSLDINVTGATFEKALNKSLSTKSSSRGHAQAIFDWTPDLTDVSHKPYIDVFRGSEYHGSYTYITDITVAIIVSATAPNGIASTEANLTDITAYPNPANERLLVEVNTAQQCAADIRLYDVSGRVVVTISDGQVFSGKTVFSENIQHLPPGIYILNGILDGKHFTQKVAVE